MTTGSFMPINTHLSDIGAAPAVAVVERGPGQPRIEGLANTGVQPTAARATMSAAAADAAR
jgi:hypothetical protein